MYFKEWLEATEPEQHPYNNFQRQRFFPFIHQANDERIDPKKVLRYKSPETFAKAAQKGGRQTEMAAERICSAPIGSFFTGPEKVVGVWDNAVLVPGYEMPPSQKYPQGLKRSESGVAFVVVQGEEPMPNGQTRQRILAYYQGVKPKLDREQLKFLHPIGGLVAVGSSIIDVWVHPEHRSNPQAQGSWSNYKLYRSLREFAASRGLFDLEPGDDLTSKSFRASDAKYQYRRAQDLKNGR